MANKVVDEDLQHSPGPGLVGTAKQELECPICLEQLKEPKVLSCLHTFCMECLETLRPTKDDDHDEENDDEGNDDEIIEIGAQARVLYLYDAEQDDELSLHIGATIQNVDVQDGGWWGGEINGRRGVFPENFVELIKKEEPRKIKEEPPKIKEEPPRIQKDDNDKNDDEQLICPICRTETQIPENDVSALKSNFVVQEMIEVLNLQSKAVTGGMVCNMCEGDDSVTCLCNECRYFLCSVCATYHKRYKVTKNHNLSSVEEAENLDSKQLMYSRKSKPNHCLKHDNEILKLYCEACKEVICSDCMLFDHNAHEYSFINEIVKQRKERLNEMINTSKKLLSETQRAEQGIREMIKKVNANQKVVKNEIKESFDNVIRQINARVQELYKEVDEIADKKTKALDAQLLNSSLLSDAISFAESILKHCNDIEIMEMDSSVQNRLDNLCNGLSDVSPVEGDGISIYPDSSERSTATLYTAIDNYITSINGYSFDPEKCSVSIVEQDTDPKRSFEFRITTKTKDSTICGSQFDKVQVYIKEPKQGHTTRQRRFLRCLLGKTGLCEVQADEGHSILTGKIPTLHCPVNYYLYLSLNDVQYLLIIFKWNSKGEKFDAEPTFEKVNS